MPFFFCCTTQCYGILKYWPLLPFLLLAPSSFTNKKNADGIGLQKVSRDKDFEAFPMFSPNGKKIVFCSNRNYGGTRDTNIFIADWED